MQKRLNEINEELAQIEARSAEINTAVETAEHDELERMNTEVSALEERKAALLVEKADLEAKEEEARSFDESKATEIELRHEEPEIMEENKMFGIETPEYRDAFYAVLGNYATPEQRAIVVDSTAPGDGDALAIPKSLDEKIWDNIHTAHPILADVATVASGMALEVTKHTAIAVRTSKKLDSAATPAEEANTFAKVVLYGYDYEKYVTLTYAEAKMSAGALENYLADEIAAELGEALAKDVFAQILTDAGAGQKVTSASDYFADIKSALALATTATRPVIYAPAAAYYNIVGAIAQGSPFNIGQTLGCEVKLDSAATKVTIVDPKDFVLNMVQPVMVESDRDITNHKVVVSGYLRAQGTLRKNKSAAYID